VRSLIYGTLFSFGVVLFCNASFVHSEDAAASTIPERSSESMEPNTADWFPETTQGFARIVDFPKFLDRWHGTQLGKLAEDSRLQNFWKEQQKTIESRFAEAGWQLNIKADDIQKVASGQAAMAWISKPQDTQKPYAVSLIVNTKGRAKELEELMAKIETELKTRQATSQSINQEGASITQYTLPRGPGELVIRQSFYAVANDYLFATDELPALIDLLKAQKAGRQDSLSQSALFKKAMGRLSDSSRSGDVEYFIQPIGLAKLLRSISGKPVAAQTDILKVLDEQGFGKLAAIVGRLKFGEEKFDIYHDAFIQTEPPLPTSVQVLDFPNEAGRDIPSFVTPQAASFLSMAWNAKDAFWKVEKLVDAIANQPGVFESVIDGIKNDPQGPQIDVRTQLLPYITPEIYSVAEVVLPITPDSRRSLVAIRILDPEGKLAGALERAMKNEPDATPEDFGNVRIWKVERPDESFEAKVEGNFDFGGKSKKPAKPKPEDEPLLSNWAITIYPLKTADGKQEDYLMFGSDAEMIKDAINQAQSDGKQGTLETEADVAKVLSELKQQAGDNRECVWEVSRADRAFRMQYELFRQDKLPQSRSILATILDRILRPKDELKNVDQRVKGAKLPPFDDIKSFFTPSGSRVVTHPDGWSYQGFVLGP
jgi:hypothetical protein